MILTSGSRQGLLVHVRNFVVVVGRVVVVNDNKLLASRLVPMWQLFWLSTAEETNCKGYYVSLE